MQTSIDTIRSLLEAGRFPEVYELSMAFLQQDPASTDVWYMASVAARHTGRMEEARMCGRRILTLAPDFTGGLYANSASALDLNRLDEAALWGLRTVRLNPSFESARVNLLLAYERQGKLHAALKVASDLVVLYPDNSVYWSNLFVICYSLKRWKAADLAATRSLRLTPGSRQALRVFARSMLERGDDLRAEWALAQLDETAGSAGEQCLIKGLRQVLPQETEAREHRTLVGTVVIPAFKAESFIVRALDSVERSATYYRYKTGEMGARFRIVVVDDASPDGTAEIVRAWGKDQKGLEVLTLSVNCNRGQARARNIGAELAAGEALWFLDSDDMFLPTHMATCLQLLRDNPDLGSVKTGMILDLDIHIDWQQSVEYTCPSNLCVRPECFALLGGFPEEQQARALEDGFFADHLSSFFMMGMSSEKTIWHTQREGNAFSGQIQRFMKPMHQVRQEEREDQTNEPRFPASSTQNIRLLRRLEPLREKADWTGPPIQKVHGTYCRRV